MAVPSAVTGGRAARGKFWLTWTVFAILAVLPWVLEGLGQDYYLGFVRRELIVLLAVTSLDLLIGHGGMAALGHAGFVGVGAYTLVGLTEAGVDSAWLAWSAAALVAALASAAIGAIALRTRGVYFIMITLAFAQMLYYLAMSLRVFGGDDGYNLAARPSLGVGLSLDSDKVFYGVVLAFFALVFFGFKALLSTRFGHALQAVRDNESRMTALGYPVFRIRLAAFMLAGAVAGLSGALLIVHNGFVTPGSLQWSQSAVLVVMVMLGGLGRTWGPALGVALWMALEEVLRQYTDLWHWPIGTLLILVALYVPKGIASVFDKARS